MADPQFKVSWSKDGSCGKGQESDHAFTSLEYARAFADTKVAKNRSVTILRADGDGINAGKFFLHLIVK